MKERLQATETRVRKPSLSQVLTPSVLTAQRLRLKSPEDECTLMREKRFTKAVYLDAKIKVKSRICWSDLRDRLRKQRDAVKLD